MIPAFYDADIFAKKVSMDKTDKNRNSAEEVHPLLFLYLIML